MSGLPSYSASAAYGLPSIQDVGATPDATPLASIATAAGDDASKAWHPDSPLFWLGIIGALTFGFAFLSTTVRVGPARATVSAGKE